MFNIYVNKLIYGGIMKKLIKILLLIFFIFPFINVYADDFEITSKNAVLFNLSNNEII